jgi:integrase
VFSRLNHTDIRRQWATALERAELEDPRPVIHDLRHTHFSGLIADGWDPVEVAGRIGDTLATTLRVHSHEFDSARRSGARRAALETRYGTGMATNTPRQTATDGAKVQRLPTHRKTG